MKKTIIENVNPLTAMAAKGENAKDAGIKAVINGSADSYGACSIEIFSSASSLGLTHEDAQGWLDYVTQFTPGNFWYTDAGVQVWLYEETHDNYQDTYGADAVNAFYHSGHGVMDENGVYQAPLGSKWDNRDWLLSSNMRVGDEKLRYLFLSTCYSLRVFAPHNPVRTWHQANLGFRMLFGYETTSVDDANYGKYFWEEWRKGKPFSTAFLDASWRISQNQVPAVLATGVTAAEAADRLENEKQFFTQPGSTNFYNWRWYNAARSVAPQEVIFKKSLPSNPQVALLAANTYVENEIAKFANQLGLTKKATNNLLIDKDGFAYFKDKNKIVTVSKDGSINMQLDKHNYGNTKAIEYTKAVGIAGDVLRGVGIGKHADLQLDQVIHGYNCVASTIGSGKMGDPEIVETIVQYRQLVDGIPSINSGNGLVRVTIDNDGKVTNIIDSTKKITDLSAKAKGSLAPESAKSKKAKLITAVTGNLEEAFEAALNKQVNRNNVGLRAFEVSKKYTAIEDKVGYSLSGRHGSLVAHREYEVDLGNRLQKRYKVRVPLFA